MQRTVIVGDVHGMLTALEALMDALELARGDRLIFVGDLVDKGPEPAGVLHYLADLSRTAPYEIVLVEGNHEDRHRRYQLNLTERPGVAAQQARDAPELPALAAELTEDGRAFLNSAIPFYRVAAHGLLIVHGGIPGNMRRFPGTVQEADALKGREREAFRKVLRTRYVDKDTGFFRGLDQEKPGDPFWAEVYDGRFGHVLFGHHPFLGEPAEFTHATGLDTGAVHGDGLTAIIYPETGPRHYVQIPTETCAPRR